jgi:peroxiredoxin Q/BCP
VIGISRDSVADQAKFKAKYELPFKLLSDPDARVCEAYGVWKEKENYGKKYMGIERTTFLIDEDSKIAKVYPKVKVEGHAHAVLDDLS